MPSNPFKRSESPRDRFDKARRGVATTARGVRDGADRVARALDDSDGEKRGRSGPKLAVGAAVLGARTDFWPSQSARRSGWRRR
jgi:hypothetical protein